MSHKATYWLATLDPKLITSGAFRVLFHLCDYHNDERDPESACFPSQETLMRKTGLSNGGLNKCLDTLQTVGLLERRRSTIPGTSKRRTYFILGCDVDLTTRQTPQSGDSPNSTGVETATEQTPLLNGANSTFEHSKLHPSGEEPVKEPVKEQCVSKIDPHTDFFNDFWEAHPRPNGEQNSRQLFDAAVEAGADPAHIVAAAMAYEAENEGNRRQYLKMSDGWLADERWKNHKAPAAKKVFTNDERLTFYANMVNNGKAVSPSAINVGLANELLNAGLVTIEKLKERGIAA
jgi:hypothetical protein